MKPLKFHLPPKFPPFFFLFSIVLLASVSKLNAQCIQSDPFSGSSLASFWTAADINVTAAGSQSEGGGALTINGDGAGFPGGATTDGFRYIYQPVSGDLDVTLEIMSVPGQA